MKPVALLLLLLALAAGCATVPGARYTLVPAQITTSTDAGVQLQAHTIFKIDTQTGQTWEHFSLNIDNRSIEGWSEIRTYRPGEAILSGEAVRMLMERTASKPDTAPVSR